MSTSSANATALPDRRLFLSTFAAAGLLTGGAALAAYDSPADHPDAELIGLDRQLAAALTLYEDLGERADVAYEAHVEPEMPEAVLWQKRDFPGVWVDRHRLDGLGSPEDGSERFTYASEGVLEQLRDRLAGWKATTAEDRFNFTDRNIARVEEIIAGLEAWYAERDRDLDACGFTAAAAAHDAQCAAVGKLVHRIAALPARTAEGVCIKARSALAISLGGVDWLEEQLAAKLAAPARLSDERRRLLLLSAMIDAAKLGAVASSDRRAA